MTAFEEWYDKHEDELFYSDPNELALAAWNAALEAAAEIPGKDMAICDFAEECRMQDIADEILKLKE